MNELDKIHVGKKSLKTIFKSNKETENYGQTLQKNIDNQESIPVIMIPKVESDHHKQSRMIDTTESLFRSLDPQRRAGKLSH